ncbi:hypothetical protein D3C73_1104070 [compost metagenome]
MQEGFKAFGDQDLSAIGTHRNIHAQLRAKFTIAKARSQHHAPGVPALPGGRQFKTASTLGDGADTMAIDDVHPAHPAGGIQRPQQLQRIDVAVHGRITRTHHGRPDAWQTGAQLLRVQQLERIIAVHGLAQPQ